MACADINYNVFNHNKFTGKKRLLGSRSPRFQGHQMISDSFPANQSQQYHQHPQNTRHNARHNAHHNHHPQQQQHAFVDLTTKHRKSFRSQSIREQRGRYRKPSNDDEKWALKCIYVTGLHDGIKTEIVHPVFKKKPTVSLNRNTPRKEFFDSPRSRCEYPNIVNDDWKIGSPHRSEPYSFTNDIIKRRGFRWSDSQSQNQDAVRSHSCEPYLLGGETDHDIYYSMNRLTGSHTPSLSTPLKDGNCAYVIGINGSTNNSKPDKTKKSQNVNIESSFSELGAPLCWADELSRASSKVMTPRSEKCRPGTEKSEERHSVVFKKDASPRQNIDSVKLPRSPPGQEGYKVSRVDRHISDNRRITNICITNKDGCQHDENRTYDKLLDSYRATADADIGVGCTSTDHVIQRTPRSDSTPTIAIPRRYEPPPTPIGRPGTAVGYVRPARAELTIRGGAPPAECPPLSVSTTATVGGVGREQTSSHPARPHHQRAPLHCTPMVSVDSSHTEYISIASRMKTQTDCSPNVPLQPTPKPQNVRKITPAIATPPVTPPRPPSPPAISTRPLCVEKPPPAPSSTPAPVETTPSPTPVQRQRSATPTPPPPPTSSREYAFNIPTGSTELMDSSDCETTLKDYAQVDAPSGDKLVFAAAGIVNSAINSAKELMGNDATTSARHSSQKTSAEKRENEVRSVTFLTDDI